MVFCGARNAREEELWEQCKNRIARHLSSLVKQVFLNVRPCQPCQARWTGVAGVAAFCFGLFQFHKLLGRLLVNNTGRAGREDHEGEAAGDRNEGAGANNGDADVWAPGPQGDSVCLRLMTD